MAGQRPSDARLSTPGWAEFPDQARPSAAPQVSWAEVYSHRSTYVALNALTGAVTAAGQLLLRPGGDRSTGALLEAAVGGALGGLTNATGMSIVGAGTPALRLAGLQTVSIGSSMIRNAGRGSGLGGLGRDLSFVFSPLVVDLSPEGARVRASASSMVLLGCALSGRGARVEWGETALAGTVVLSVPHSFVGYADEPCGLDYAGWSMGVAFGGMVVLPRGEKDLDAAARAGLARSWVETLPHELVHVAQHTRDLVTLRTPASDALRGLVRTAPGPDGAPAGLAPRFAPGLRNALARFMGVLIVDPFSPTTAINHALRATDPGRGWINSYSEREAEGFLGHPVCTGAGHRICTW